MNNKLHKNNIYYFTKDPGYCGESGQALLFVIVALTVALSLGIAASSRTLSSLRRTTGVDSSSRSYTIAEGGMEFFLNQPVSVLSNLSDGDNSDGTECPTGTEDYEVLVENDDGYLVDTNTDSCVVRAVSQSTDKIESQAVVSVGEFKYNSPEDASEPYYWFNVEPGDVKEVTLARPDSSGNLVYFTSGGNASLAVCWRSLDSTVATDLYYIMYSEEGIYRRGAIQNHSATNNSTVGNSVTAVVASSYSGATGTEYTDCYWRTTNGDLYVANSEIDEILGLRIKSLYGASEVAVFVRANENRFPTQGYKITSVGEIVDDKRVRTTSKKTVYRSYQYAPSVFDYSLYSPNGPLSIIE